MHEFVYADKIVQSAITELGARKGEGQTVSVQVGEMLGLTRESLTMAYRILSKGTPAEGSRLLVRFEKGETECPGCGFKGRLKLRTHEHLIDPVFACPKCGSSLRITAGLDVRIKSIK
jgi:hydrogenase nickel incorporation protein HypA/HybF